MLIPCIDLQGGQAVQLVRGRKPELAVADVMGLLNRFRIYPWLHVIDLDAAMGTGSNDELVHELCVKAHKRYGMKVRVGGGIRTVSRAAEITKQGAEQIIIGSAAFRQGKVNVRFFARLLRNIERERIVVALDTIKGRIAVHGWRDSLALRPEYVMAHLELFCAAFLCTDVDREGTMRGANYAWFQKLRNASSHPIIAAGGIKNRQEITALEKIGIDAALGMALYTKRLR